MSPTAQAVVAAAAEPGAYVTKIPNDLNLTSGFVSLTLIRAGIALERRTLRTLPPVLRLTPSLQEAPMTQLFLYADIETIPSQDPTVLAEILAKHTAPLCLDDIKPAANLTDPGKIEADIEKRRIKAVADHEASVAKAAATSEEEYRKTCLDAATGHIACIHAYLEGDREGGISVTNWALEEPLKDRGLYPLKDVLSGERDMIADFFAILDGRLRQSHRDRASAAWEACEPVQLENGRWQIKITPDHVQMVEHPGKWIQDRVDRSRTVPTVVAHHAGFDVRYIWQRAIVLGVQPIDWWPIDAKPWDTDRVDDTMIAWAGQGGRISLDRLCRALGIKGKGDVDGSMVWDLVKAGKLEEVSKYCDDDVSRLRAVHRKIRHIADPVPVAEPEGDLPDWLEAV